VLVLLGMELKKGEQCCFHQVSKYWLWCHWRP
jgi:hypothetical protein